MSDILTLTGLVDTTPDGDASIGAVKSYFQFASSKRIFDNETRRWVEQRQNTYTVVAFNDLAQNILASIHKGDRIFVIGKLHIREADGKTEILIEASMVGHDLNWATTTATRVKRSK